MPYKTKEGGENSVLDTNSILYNESRTQCICGGNLIKGF